MADPSSQLDLGGLELIVNTLRTGATGAGKQGSSANVASLTGVTAGTAGASQALITDSGTKLNGLKQLGLAAGTATIAPLTFTSGTNLTAAAAGAVEFDGSAFYLTALASARQQADAEQFIIATANSATYNNTGLDTTTTAAALFTSTTNAGITNGALTVAAGATYIFEFLYNLTNTGTTSHTWATQFGGTATFSTGTNYQVFGNSSGTANAAATGGLSGFIASTTMSTAVTATPASTSATEQVAIEGYGVFVINAGGTIIPQMQASARPGATGTPGVVFKAGSYFRVWQMANANFVGNWG